MGAGVLARGVRSDTYTHEYGKKGAKKRLCLREGTRFRVKGGKTVYTFAGYWEQTLPGGRQRSKFIEAWSAEEGTRYLYVGKRRILACGHVQAPYKIRPVRRAISKKSRANSRGKKE